MFSIIFRLIFRICATIIDRKLLLTYFRVCLQASMRSKWPAKLILGCLVFLFLFLFGSLSNILAISIATSSSPSSLWTDYTICVVLIFTFIFDSVFDNCGCDTQKYNCYQEICAESPFGDKKWRIFVLLCSLKTIFLFQLTIQRENVKSRMFQVEHWNLLKLVEVTVVTFPAGQMAIVYFQKQGMRWRQIGVI